MRQGEAFFFTFLLMLVSALTVIIMQLVLRHRRQLLLHQERMAALDKGVNIPLSVPEPGPSPRVYLLRGLMWTCASFGLVVFLLGMSWATQKPTYHSSIAYRAHELERLGVAPEQARSLAEQDARAGAQGMPVGFALFGLIPLGVGIAYLVFYYTDESRSRADLIRSETPVPRG